MSEPTHSASLPPALGRLFGGLKIALAYQLLGSDSNFIQGFISKGVLETIAEIQKTPNPLGGMGDMTDDERMIYYHAIAFKFDAPIDWQLNVIQQMITCILNVE